MPGGDRTGPAGEGPMTGRAMGWCNDTDFVTGVRTRAPGFGRGGWGRRGGWGGRGGWGWGHRGGVGATGLTSWQGARMGGPVPDAGSPPALPLEQELAGLRQQAASLERALDQVKARLQRLDRPTREETE
ncbi:MAG: DUF5320 domain-containing protein [Candidatus Eiseniibacteriota bacterium]